MGRLEGQRVAVGLRGCLWQRAAWPQEHPLCKLHAVIPAVALPHCGPGERRRLVADYDFRAQEHGSACKNKAWIQLSAGSQTSCTPDPLSLKSVVIASHQKPKSTNGLAFSDLSIHSRLLELFWNSNCPSMGPGKSHFESSPTPPPTHTSISLL